MGDRVVETHCSTLFFVDDLVYKRKKPLDLGFADFRTVEARRRACEAEVSLNRRLTPDVYLGVATVLGPDGRPCDSLVVMRRMPDERRLGLLASTGAELRPALRRIAGDLAALHACSPAPARLSDLARPEWLQGLWDAGLDALVPSPSLVAPDVRERTRALALRYLAGRAPLFAERQADGRLVDGHGDLLADDVFLLEDGPRVLDCLEFDERLRVGDGLLDAAFLVMDLERLGRADLASAFLDAYRTAAADDAPTSLVHHFVAYRAHIRSKVACIRATQTGAEADVTAARRLADLALEHLESGRVRLVLVGGAPGSGKTTVARAVAASLRAEVLSSDLVRKALVGLGPLDSAAAPPGEGIYSPAQTEDTYAELASLAEQRLERGTSVVVDATFTCARHRAEMRALAVRTSSDLTELACVVDDAAAVSRIRDRVADPSDATPAVRDALVAATDPWPEAEVLDTAADLPSTLRAALAVVG